MRKQIKVRLYADLFHVQDESQSENTSHSPWQWLAQINAIYACIFNPRTCCRADCWHRPVISHNALLMPAVWVWRGRLIIDYCSLIPPWFYCCSAAECAVLASDAKNKVRITKEVSQLWCGEGVKYFLDTSVWPAKTVIVMIYWISYVESHREVQPGVIIANSCSVCVYSFPIPDVPFLFLTLFIHVIKERFSVFWHYQC